MPTISEILLEAHRHLEAGETDTGLRLIDKVLEFDGTQPGALALKGLHLLGNADEGQVLQAASHLWRAHRAGVPAAQVLLPLAARLIELDTALLAAARATAQSLAENPGNGAIAHLLAVSLTGRQSLRFFNLAVALTPMVPEVLYNAARAIQESRTVEADTAALGKRLILVLRLAPGRTDVRIQFTNLMADIDHRALADFVLPAALALDPGSGLIWEKAAVTSLALLRHHDAAHAFDRAAFLETPPGKRHADRLFSMIYREGETDETIFQANRAWGKAVEGSVPPDLRVPAQPRSRIRVAYLSPEFKERHNHMASFGATLAAHNRDAFEIICYADVPVIDREGEWVRAHSDQFVLVHGLRHEEIARRIAADSPDIAVNLCCWYAEDRKPFASRMAPVQVAYNNEVSTSGLSRIDWRITDEWADPPAVDAWNSEKIWRLPAGFSTWRVPVGLPDPGPLPWKGTEGPTFGVFNNLSKLSPAAIRVFAEIVSETPDARLLLKAAQLDDRTIRARVVSLFQDAGLPPGRIDLIGMVRGDGDHFAAIAKADIGLDPFPFCGGKSTIDALWMGVPVVTLSGTFTMSRMGASILNRAGLGDWVGRTEAEYIQLAKDLGQDKERLDGLRAGMRNRLSRSLLMDARAHTRDLENAYRHFVKESGHV